MSPSLGVHVIVRTTLKVEDMFYVTLSLICAVYEELIDDLPEKSPSMLIPKLIS